MNRKLINVKCKKRDIFELQISTKKMQILFQVME